MKNSKRKKRKILSTGALSPNNDINASFAHLSMLNLCSSKSCIIRAQVIQWQQSGPTVLSDQTFNIPPEELRILTVDVANTAHYEIRVDKTNASKNCIVNTFAINSDEPPPVPVPGFTFLQTELTKVTVSLID